MLKGWFGKTQELLKRLIPDVFAGIVSGITVEAVKAVIEWLLSLLKR